MYLRIIIQYLLSNLNPKMLHKLFEFFISNRLQHSPLVILNVLQIQMNANYLGQTINIQHLIDPFCYHSSQLFSIIILNPKHYCVWISKLVCWELISQTGFLEGGEILVEIVVDPLLIVFVDFGS